MKKLSIAILGVAMFAVSLAAGETWKGAISDAKCGAAHADASEKAIKCVNGCVKGGQAAVFVVDGKVLKIANQDKVQGHLGHIFEITIKLEGYTFTVESVKHIQGS